MGIGGRGGGGSIPARTKQKGRRMPPLLFGAADRNRTGTDFTPRDFKSLVSTYSTTAANINIFICNRVSTYSPVWGARYSPRCEHLRRLSTPALAYAPLLLPLAARSNAATAANINIFICNRVSTYSPVWGARYSPRCEHLRRLSTPALAYAPLLLPLAARSNAAMPAWNAVIVAHFFPSVKDIRHPVFLKTL